MPKVLNEKIHGVPEGSVYVGRPTKWGNPYHVGGHGDRNTVIHLFEKYIEDRPHLRDAAVSELKGKDLVCWCAPLPCHADVLLRIANEEDR
jgi:hypothetical protein